MALFKTVRNGKGPVRGLIKDYLEKHIDTCGELDFNRIEDKENWHNEMNRVREAHGHHIGANRGEARTYFHFCIRPDAEKSEIEANIDLSALKVLAQNWANENLYEYQYVIGYHHNEIKDEDGMVIGRAPGYHAHIIVNCTNMSTGKKFHTNNAQADAIANSCQRIAAELGMSSMIELDYKGGYRKTQQPSYLTSAERELMAKGIIPWKEQVRRAAITCAEKSTDFKGFQAKMRSAGFDAYLTNRGVTFVAQYKGRAVKVRDHRLGTDFSKEHLSKLFTPADFVTFNKRAYRNVKEELGYKARVLDLGGGKYRYLRQSSAQHIVDAIEVIDKYQFKTKDELFEMLDSLRVGVAKTGSGYSEHAQLVSAHHKLSGAVEKYTELLPIQNKLESLSGRARERYADKHRAEFVMLTALEKQIREAGIEDVTNYKDELLRGAASVLAASDELEAYRSEIIEISEAAKTVEDIFAASMRAENLERKRLGLPPSDRVARKVKRLPKDKSKVTLGDLGVNFEKEFEFWNISEQLREDIMVKQGLGKNVDRREAEKPVDVPKPGKDIKRRPDRDKRELDR